MKIGISGRLVASHAAIALLVLVIFAVVVVTTTSRQALRTGLDVDRATAQRLAPWIEEYFRNERSWDDAGPLFSEPRDPAGSHRMMPPMMGNRRRPNVPSPFLDQPIVIVADDGSVLFRRSVPDSLPRQLPGTLDIRDGVPIELPDGEEGYLFVGAMVAAESNLLSTVFLRSTLRAAVVAGIVLFLSVSAISVFWVRWLLQPIRDLHHASGEISTGNYAERAPVPRGQHELADLVVRFNAMAGEIQAQEESRKRFVGDAAHELRTPISLLTARIQMLREGIYRTDDEQWSALTHDVERLGDLVDDLQTLARADAGKLSLSLQPWSVEEALHGTCSRMEPAAYERRITLRLSVAPQVASEYIVVDPQRFQQIMSNLIGNAIRYTPSSGEILIEATSKREGNDTWIEIAIEDHGPGINVSDRERIFKRFVRIDNDRNRSGGGSGLGLAITSELVQMHGGRIRVEDALNNSSGSRFIVSLPPATGGRHG